MTEIKEWYELLLESGGSFNIQLSGGEPTMRDDLPEILRMGRLAGFPFFQLNTNGLRLAEDPAYAAELRAAGLDCVFLQFDGLRDVVYQRLRGRALLAKKLRAIESCGAAGLGVVLVPTIVPDVNEGEIGTILQFAEKHVPVVRGVHFQPVSYFGRYPDGPGRRITIPYMLRLFEQQTDGRMKATDFSPGSAENAYCSFHASYLVLPDGGLRAYEKREHSCCGGDAAAARSAVARQWASVPQTTEKDDGDSLSINGFLHYAKEHTIAISGMVFQDAWNLDLDRLKNCYIHVVSPDRRVIPFCAYNLTSADGKPLYREVLS